MADHFRVQVINSKHEWDATLHQASNDSKIVVVDFSATWCGPCRVIGPVFAELSKKYPQIIFLKVDVDDVPEVAEECRISAMPTFQVYKDWKKVEELVGASKDKLDQLIKKYSE